MLTLRPHQEEMISATREAMRTHRSVLMQGPTGVGKTVLASYMAQRAVASGKRVFFICHRKELIDQTSSTFTKNDIRHGYIASGYRYNPHFKIHICSIDTLKGRLDKVGTPDLCIWDECHHLGAAGWSRVHGHYDKAYHVGLSATPVRLDGKGLDAWFSHLVNGPTVEWLIANKYLASYRLFSIPGVDLSGVHTRMGDYVKSEVNEAMDKTCITGDIIKHWRKYAEGRMTIGFAASRTHSEHICEQFREAGISAAHLDGTTPKVERRLALQQFARGEIKVVFNVGLFGEGFDVSANSGLDVTVGCVIDAAPTQSLGAWLQRCGRGLRAQSDKAIILDHAGNAMRHGAPCEQREWLLEGIDKKAKAKDDEPSLRQCEKCFFTYKAGHVCPECGHVHKIKERHVAEEAGELEEIDPAELKRKNKEEQRSAKTQEDLIALGIKRGYKNPTGWARHIFNARGNRNYVS